MRTCVWAALCVVWVSSLAGLGRAALSAPLVLTDLMDPALDRGKVRTILTRETGVGLRLEPPPPELLDSLGVLPPPGILERCDQEGAVLRQQLLGLLPERRVEPFTFYQLFGLEQELVDVRLLELDLDAVDTHVQAAWKLVPCLERLLQPEEVRALFLADAVSQVIRGASQADARLQELMGAAPGVGLEADAPPKVQKAFARVLPLSNRQRTRTLVLGELSSSMWIDGRLVEGPVALRPGRHIVQVRGIGRLVRTRVLTVPAVSGKGSGATIPLEPIVIEPLFQEKPWTDLQAARRALEQALASGSPGLSYQGVLEAWLERQGRTEAAFVVSKVDASALSGVTTPQVRIFRRGRGLIPLQEVLSPELGSGTGQAAAPSAMDDRPQRSSVQKDRPLDVGEASGMVEVSAREASTQALSVRETSEQEALAAEPSARVPSEQVAEESEASSAASGQPSGASDAPGDVQGAAGLLPDIPTAGLPQKRPPASVKQAADEGRAGVNAVAALEIFGAPQLSAGLRLDVPLLLGEGALVQQGGAGVQVGGILPAGPALLLASASFLLVRPGDIDSADAGCGSSTPPQDVSQAQAELMASCLPTGSVYALEVGAGTAVPLWESLELVPSLRGMILSVPGLLLPGGVGDPAWTMFRSVAGGGRLVLGARWIGERVGFSVDVGLAGLLVPAGTAQRWLGLFSVTPGVEVLF